MTERIEIVKIETLDELQRKELADALRESLILLTTTSPDKRRKFELLFNYLSVNAYFTRGGAVKLVPPRTEEAKLSYSGNGEEKARLQYSTLHAREREVRDQLDPSNRFDPEHINIVGLTEDSGWHVVLPDRLSGQEAEFLEQIKAVIDDRKLMRRRDYQRYLGDLKEFPGPDLHPLQERLGGFNAMMQVIYQAAANIGLEDNEALKYENTSHIALSVLKPKSIKGIYTQDFQSTGTLLTRKQYNTERAKVARGRRVAAINTDFIHIPDGQEGPPEQHKTLTDLEYAILTHPSSEVPADHPRREAVEFIKELTDIKEPAEALTVSRKPETISVGYVSPTKRSKEDWKAEEIAFGTKAVDIPTERQLLNFPQLKPFDDADAIVLRADEMSKSERIKQNLLDDPNLAMVLNAIVLTETDPQSMNMPLILDNRKREGEKEGPFDYIIRFIVRNYCKGRLIGDLPFRVANTDAQLEDYVREVQTIKQLSPKITHVGLKHLPENLQGNLQEDEDSQEDLEEYLQKKKLKSAQPPEAIPDDGIFTLFIGGGRNNSSRRDLEDATRLGYLCAENGWRIVTGAGSVEGSMGTIHTGFIQYHLEQIIENEKSIVPALEALERTLREASKHMSYTRPYDTDEVLRRNPGIVQTLREHHMEELLDRIENRQKQFGTTDIFKALETINRTLNAIGTIKRKDYAIDGKPDAETLILKESESINTLADNGLIPRNLFYGYSMANLLKMENPTGDPPPGIHYIDAGNLSRRLAALCAPGTKVIMKGGTGTDQELDYTLKQHIERRQLANDNFIDGTPKDQSALIIYNPNRNLDDLLHNYGLLGDEAEGRRRDLNIIVVSDDRKLQAAVKERASKAEGWLAQRRQEKTGKTPGINEAGRSTA